MHHHRKNSSCLALTDDTIYVFAGSTHHSSAEVGDSIEQYSIIANSWNLLKIKMPLSGSFFSIFKVSSNSIIILGGSIDDFSKKNSTHKTNSVFMLDLMKPEFKRLMNLPMPLISIYPPFYDAGVLHLIDEDNEAENAVVLKYDIASIIATNQ